MTAPNPSATGPSNRRAQKKGNRGDALWLAGSAVSMATGVTLVWLAAERTTGDQMTPMVEVVVALGVTLSLAAIWAFGKCVPSFVAEVIDDIGGDPDVDSTAHPMIERVTAALTAVGAAAPVYFAVALTTTGSIGNESVTVGIIQASLYALGIAPCLRALSMVWRAFRDRPARTTAV